MTATNRHWNKPGRPAFYHNTAGICETVENCMSGRKPDHKGQPEALATFAAAATHGGKKPDDIGLGATRDTAAVPTKPEDKADAATKVLREGVLGTDQGADAAVDKLPDRIHAAAPQGT
jgi:hypothetical protein